MAYIAFHKQSKKMQREENQRRRGNWGEIKPITKKKESDKVYQRTKAWRWHKDATDGLFQCAKTVAWAFPFLGAAAFRQRQAMEGER